MRIKKSTFIKGQIGFFTEDEYEYPEEFLTVASIHEAKKIVNQLQKDIHQLAFKKK